MMSKPLIPIPALIPQDGLGHQFICYADSCSGVPGALHENTFAAVNAVVAQLTPPPEFICFPGDEIIGLTADENELRRQWRHWFDQEMAWLDRASIPLYHTTANHTTYDPMSTAIFREVLDHLPQNAPTAQKGLAYFVQRDDLLLIFVDTMGTGLGGEGRVETTWLAETLAAHADARYKLVFGHHPIHPVNGFIGPYLRHVEDENGRAFWQILIEHQVLAYICSHILAFDAQVHQGVLQILTGGAGTAHRMPEGVEYLHCLQAALDVNGLRYQVLDTAGQVREWLQWPITLPPATTWPLLSRGENLAPPIDNNTATHLSGTNFPNHHLLCWQISGICPSSPAANPQTLLSAWDQGGALAPLWIGLLGLEQQLSVLIAPMPGRSPHLWRGPSLEAGQPFTLQIAFHTGMGPGGLLWRPDENSPWSSLAHTAAWGAERLKWPHYWSVGQAQQGATDRPFQGDNLQIRWYHQPLSLSSSAKPNAH